MARTDKLPAEPGLPRPVKDFGQWLHQLTTRLHSWMRQVIDQVNLLLDGYLLNVTALPTAEEKSRGRVVFLRGGAGVADQAYVCRKNAADAYEWKEVSLV